MTYVDIAAVAILYVVFFFYPRITGREKSEARKEMEAIGLFNKKSFVFVMFTLAMVASIKFLSDALQ